MDNNDAQIDKDKYIKSLEEIIKLYDEAPSKCFWMEKMAAIARYAVHGSR